MLTIGDGTVTNPNKMLGSISMSDNDGLEGDGSNGATFANDIGINNVTNVNASSVGRTTLSNLTSYHNINATYPGIGFGYSPNVVTEVSPPGFTATNLLSFNNSGLGIWIYTTYYSTWTIDHSNAGGNHFYPSPDSRITNGLDVVPTLMGTGSNQCIVYVPGGNDGRGGQNPQIGGVSSNMAGAGVGTTGGRANDIGADIVYEYVNGSLTSTKLWNQSTGQFPCGAIVPGVNDIAGSSCFDVNKRLNVGVNGCPIP